MFTDYLSVLISKNVRPDNFLNTNPQEIQEAIEYIRSGEIIKKDTPKTILARRVFAQTLKDQLQDPESELNKTLNCGTSRRAPGALRSAQKLINPRLLHETLQDSYLHSIAKINQFMGHQCKTIEMPGPFVVPKITAITGIKAEEIGHGSYGEVYKTTKGFAIKSLVRKDDIDLPYTVLKETATLHYLQHPNIINPTAIQLKPAILAMPLAVDGTLDDYEYEDIADRKWIFYQLFRGVAYCHSKYVWHRDIKPQNVLVFGEIVKLADFGLTLPYARITRGKDTHISTRWWRAPEILLGDNKYTEKIDIWSLGVMLLDVVVGYQLLKGADEVEQIKLIFKLLGTPTKDDWPGVTELPFWRKDDPTHDRTLPGLATFDPQELEVIQSTLTWPNQRLAAIDILKLPYFDSVREQIEIDIPARPIIIEPCREVMINDQKLRIKQEWLRPRQNQRRAIFVWLRQIQKKMRLTWQTLFFTYALFDLFLQYKEIPTEKLQLYACAAGNLASKLHEIYMPDIKDWVYVSAKSFTEKKLAEAEREILTAIDFELIFPTCDDFIYNYTEGLDIKSHDTRRVQYYAMLLLLNYSRAIKYTPAQIAQIAIEAVGLDVACLQGTGSLYSEQIKKYLKNFKVPPELAEDHAKFF